MTQFRAGFIGKCSPVDLFWGGLDLACTRFSGRPRGPLPRANLFTLTFAAARRRSSTGVKTVFRSIRFLGWCGRYPADQDCGDATLEHFQHFEPEFIDFDEFTN